MRDLYKGWHGVQRDSHDNKTHSSMAMCLCRVCARRVEGGVAVLIAAPHVGSLFLILFLGNYVHCSKMQRIQWTSRNNLRGCVCLYELTVKVIFGLADIVAWGDWLVINGIALIDDFSFPTASKSGNVVSKGWESKVDSAWRGGVRQESSEWRNTNVLHGYCMSLPQT